MSELQYKVYNRTSLYVTGDREKYAEVIKKLGGRWNNKLKPSPGWTVPLAKEEELKRLISGLDPNTVVAVSVPVKDKKDEEIEKIQQHAKSRKAQHKYHRAVSESEDEESSEKERGPISDSSSEDERKIAKPSTKPVEKVIESAKVEKKPIVVTESESASESENESESGSESSTESEPKIPQRRGSPVHVKKGQNVQHKPGKRRSGYEERRQSSDRHSERHTVRPAERPAERREKRLERRRSIERPEKHKKHGYSDRHSERRRPSPVVPKKHEKERERNYKKVYNRSEDEEDSTSVTSTSSSSSSSSDDFPLPESPRKNNRISTDYDYIQTQLKDIQKRLYNVGSHKKRA